MSIREKIKSIPMINRFGKAYYIKSQFRDDAKCFAKYYCEEAVQKGDYRYSIMLIVHSIEKGMCMGKPRPFGKEKVDRLLDMLDKTNDETSFEYQLGVSILSKWVSFYREHGWENDSIVEKCQKFLDGKDIYLLSGTYEYNPNENHQDKLSFEKTVLSRHSVRDFKNIKLKREDIDLAIRCFIETPTACNRQMCRLLYIENQKIKELLNQVVIGLPGFNKGAIQYFVITYDLAAFAYSGERQQGLFNAGLCTMNFINGLHAKGIGSCCLQWSNKTNEDILVRKALKIRESERIAVVVAAGYYLDSNTIPCSTRRSIEDIYKVIQ